MAPLGPPLAMGLCHTALVLAAPHCHTAQIEIQAQMQLMHGMTQ